MGAAQEPGAGLTAAGSWRRAWPFGAALVAYVALRVYGFADVTTLVYRDSDSYLEVARQPLLSADFWAGARAWTVPLVYKLLPDTNEARAVGQLVVSIVCWAALAASVARCLRPRAVALAGFVAVLAFSLVFAVIRWDRLILSESVSISLTAAVIAAWLWLVRSPSPRAVFAVLAISLPWVFTRDSNGLLAALTALAALAWVVRPGGIDRRWPVLLAAGLGTIFVLNLVSTGTEEAKLRRQERPILHVVGRRVLANPSQEAYFRRHGMPAPPPRVRRHRRELAAIGVTISSDPATDAFLRWVHERGRVTLARYLITHPRQTVGSVIRFRKRLLRGVTIGYRPPDAREVLPARLASLLYPERPRSVVLWLVIVLVAAGATALAAGPSRLWLVPAAAIALQLPHAILVYHGDTLEVPRHAIVMAITLRLGILLLAVLVAGHALERALAARAARSPGPP